MISLTTAFNAILEQTFAMEPQDQVAVVGARVILPCRVINKKGVLQWTKDDFGLGTKRKLVGFERYSMIGSDEEGDYSLQIYPVTLDDNARFQCQVSPGSYGKYISISFMKSYMLFKDFFLNILLINGRYCVFPTEICKLNYANSLKQKN